MKSKRDNPITVISALATGLAIIYFSSLDIDYKKILIDNTPKAIKYLVDQICLPILQKGYLDRY